MPAGVFGLFILSLKSTFSEPLHFDRGSRGGAGCSFLPASVSHPIFFRIRMSKQVFMFRTVTPFLVNDFGVFLQVYLALGFLAAALYVVPALDTVGALLVAAAFAAGAAKVSEPSTSAKKARMAAARPSRAMISLFMIFPPQGIDAAPCGPLSRPLREHDISAGEIRPQKCRAQYGIIMKILQ